MQQEGVSRFIAISTGTAPDPNDGFDWKINLPAWLIKIMMPAAYRDIVTLARAIRASQLDWTMVRVATLTNRPGSGKVNVGMYGHRGIRSRSLGPKLRRSCSIKSEAVNSRKRLRESVHKRESPTKSQPKRKEYP